MKETLLQDPHAEIREEVRKLCSQLPGEYWRKLDQARGYPTEFVRALTEGGYLGALIPEEYRWCRAATFGCGGDPGNRTG